MRVLIRGNVRARDYDRARCGGTLNSGRDFVRLVMQEMRDSVLKVTRSVGEPMRACDHAAAVSMSRRVTLIKVTKIERQNSEFTIDSCNVHNSCSYVYLLSTSSAEMYEYKYLYMCIITHAYYEMDSENGFIEYR